MAWIAPQGVWKYRACLTVIDAAGVGSNDVECTIPKGWDLFWNTIDANAEEVRVTSVWGVVFDYIIDDMASGTIDIANRIGRIRGNDWPLPAVANSAVCFFVYFGSTSAQGPADNPLASYGDTPIDGFIEMTRPEGLVYAHRSGIPGQTKPPHTFNKRVDEYRHLWINYKNELSDARDDAYGGTTYEEPYYATQSVIDTAGAGVGSMDDPGNLRFVETPDGMWVRSAVQAGTDDNYYTHITDLRTLAPFEPPATVVQTQRIQTSIGVRVYNTRHLP